MYFKLRDMEFKIAKATLKLYYYDETEASRWPNQRPGIFLVASVDTIPKKLNGEDWAPWLRHNSGIKTDIHHWTELEGKRWEFADEYYEHDNEAGFLGIFEETALKQCQFEIVKREEKKFTVRWNGIGDVFYDDDYDGDVPFTCEFIAEFKGIEIQQCVKDQTENALRKALGKTLNLDDFKLLTTPLGLKEFVFK